ncbi:hypothetical protein LUZ60_014637 [Juncus effusus]|nr:hypothetical protein LUZ60_014637 [Juncus effusus]
MFTQSQFTPHIHFHFIHTIYKMMSKSYMLKKKKRNNPLFTLGCGCGDSKSVSVSDSSESASLHRPKTMSSTDTPTMTATSASASSPWDDEDKFDNSTGTPSFSGLLRELGELEQTVLSFHSCRQEKSKTEMKKLTLSPYRGEHKRSAREGVPVVKDSEDPLEDFRQSMLQMIVEKEIIDKDELCELLRRFLALNSPRHHHLIFRAFSEIWEEVFAEFEKSSPHEFLVDHGSLNYPSPLRL